MAISTVVAGAYTSTWAGTALGFTQDGFSVQRVNHQEEINQSDIYGRTLLDAVYMGADTYIQTTCRTSNSGSRGASWPWGGAATWSGLGTIYTTALPIGILGTNASISGSIVLTAVANTPAATTADPATLTASKGAVAPNFNMELLLSSRARSIPIRFALYPTDAGGTVVPTTGTVFTAT